MQRPRSAIIQPASNRSLEEASHILQNDGRTRRQKVWVEIGTSQANSEGESEWLKRREIAFN